MNWYRACLAPRLIDWACASSDLVPWRARVCTGLYGRVVELGFGSGRNISYFPREVERVWAVEPSATARRLAGARLLVSSIPIEFLGADGGDIALDDGSCDGALATFTLCSVHDVGRTLSEIRRVLRPGGEFHFLEHGLSPDQTVARHQRRWDPLQVRLGGGCHLTRDPVALVRAAGLNIEWSESRYLRGPRPWTYLSVGVAKVPMA